MGKVKSWLELMIIKIEKFYRNQDHRGGDTLTQTLASDRASSLGLGTASISKSRSLSSSYHWEEFVDFNNILKRDQIEQ
jgi:hypothetical protein